MISKFFHYIQILPNVYATYNSLVMQVLYVNEDELNAILKADESFKEKALLYEYGIWVENQSDDDRVLAAFQELIHEQSRQLNVLYLDLASCCNLTCTYCFINNNLHSDDTAAKSKIMSKAVAITAIDKFLAAAASNLDVAQITLFGGEPLLNWSILVESVKHIRDIAPSLKVTVVTNATLLDEDKIRFLKANRVGIGVSVDGPKRINDKYRVFSNSDNKSVYDIVAKSIVELNKVGAEFSISSTVTRDLIENKESVITWLEDLSVHNVFWNLFHYSERSDSWQKFYVDMASFIESCHDDLVSHDIYDEKIQEQLNLFLKHEFKIHSCGAVGLNQITVEPDGSVCICQGDMKASSKRIGNVLTDDLDDLLQKREIAWWTEIYTIDREECLRCPALFICGGGCPLQSDALFGSRTHIDYATCIYSKWFLSWLLKECYYVSTQD